MGGSSSKVVIAIEIGNVNSGYVYGVGKQNLDHIYTATYGYGLERERVPTALLLKSDGTFDAFGYDAQDKFASISLQEGDQNYRYFDKLTIIPGKDRTLYISDIKGTQMLAEDVYTKIIKYLYDTCLEHVASSEKDLKLILVVSNASDELREVLQSAVKAIEIKAENTRIVLDTDAATAYCRHQPVLKKALPDSKPLPIDKQDKKIILVNLGGRTSTVCYQKHLSQYKYQVDDVTTMKKGGETVTDRFLCKLGSKIENVNWDEFKSKHFYDYIYLKRYFDENKRKFSFNTESVIMELPLSVIKLLEENKTEPLRLDPIFLNNHKIILKGETMKDLFMEPLETIVNEINGHYKDSKQDDVFVFLLGQFSESSFVRDYIAKMVAPKRVLLVTEPGLAVLKGAVMMEFRNTIKLTFDYGFIKTYKSNSNTDSSLISVNENSVSFEKILTKTQIVEDGYSFIHLLHLTDEEKNLEIQLVEFHNDDTEIKGSDYMGIKDIKPPESGWSDSVKIGIEVRIKHGGPSFNLKVI